MVRILKRLPTAAKQALSKENIYWGALLLWLIWGVVWTLTSNDVMVLLMGGFVCFLVWFVFMVGVHTPADRTSRIGNEDS